MSFRAKAAISVLRLVKRLGLIPKNGDIDSEIAKAKEFNKKHPYKEPSDHKALYSTVHVGEIPVLMMKQHGATHKKAILFLHGGGNQDAWKPEISFARNYGKQTGADVIYPIYPPFTEVPVTATADMIYEVYRFAVRKYDVGNIAVVGGSYGGLLAMQLITWINRNGNTVDMPGLLIMNSPFAFPETAKEWALAEAYEENDLMVSDGAFRLMMEGVMRADPNTPAHAMYPDKMDFHHAPETYIFYAEGEACSCVADAIEKTYARDGAVLHMHREPGMMHCYACAPVFPESRRDYNKQLALISGKER